MVIVLISVQDNGTVGCTPKDELPEQRGPLANDICSRAMEQVNQEF